MDNIHEIIDNTVKGSNHFDYTKKLRDFSGTYPPHLIGSPINELFDMEESIRNFVTNGES